MIASFRASKECLENFGPSCLATREGLWLSQANAAKMTTVASLKSESVVENIWVKNAGSGLVSVEILTDDGSWRMLLSNQTLMVDMERKFNCRYFDAAHFSQTLIGKPCSKLRVTAHSNQFSSSIIGLQMFLVNISPDERSALKLVEDEQAEFDRCEREFGQELPAIRPAEPVAGKKSAAKRAPSPPKPPAAATKKRKLPKYLKESMDSGKAATAATAASSTSSAKKEKKTSSAKPPAGAKKAKDKAKKSFVVEDDEEDDEIVEDWDNEDEEDDDIDILNFLDDDDENDGMTEKKRKKATSSSS